VTQTLENIFKAIELDPKVKNFTFPSHGDLTKWAKQGVLLLNEILTVREGQPGSHKNIGNGWFRYSYV